MQILLALFVEKYTRAKIDSPALCRVFNICVSLGGIIWKTLCTAY
jgi:hypothetical protein